MFKRRRAKKSTAELFVYFVIASIAAQVIYAARLERVPQSVFVIILVVACVEKTFDAQWKQLTSGHVRHLSDLVSLIPVFGLSASSGLMAVACSADADNTRHLEFMFGAWACWAISMWIVARLNPPPTRRPQIEFWSRS